MVAEAGEVGPGLTAPPKPGMNWKGSPGGTMKLLPCNKRKIIIVKTENQIYSNRVVSVSKVMPINGPQVEREFFTLSLKLVGFSQHNHVNTIS